MTDQPLVIDRPSDLPTIPPKAAIRCLAEALGLTAGETARLIAMRQQMEILDARMASARARLARVMAAEPPLPAQPTRAQRRASLRWLTKAAVARGTLGGLVEIAKPLHQQWASFMEQARALPAVQERIAALAVRSPEERG